MIEFLAGMRKAFAAGISTAILTWLSTQGFDVQTMTLADAVPSLVNGAVAGAAVWLVPNKPAA